MNNYQVSIFMFAIPVSLTIYSIFKRKWDWLPTLTVVDAMLFLNVMIIYHLTLVPGWERP